MTRVRTDKLPVVEEVVVPVGYVSHGATAGTARPDYDLVIWVGTVEPTNAQDDDLWIDTSA